MGNKSATGLLHDLLMKEEVGFKFTMQTLKDMAAEAGMDVTGGAITGFIHRAVRFGHVQLVGKVKGNEGRMIHQYEILNRDPWGFKHKTRGSYKGRTIKNRQYNPVPDLTELHSDPEPEAKTGTNYPIQSLLSDQLFLLAVDVAALEKKSITDYSTDELIAELKRRVK